MTSDIGKLICAIELRLTALDINSRQSSQIAVQQLKEIGAQAREATDGFRQCATRAGDTNRTLSWHVTMVKRMSAQVSKETRR